MDSYAENVARNLKTLMKSTPGLSTQASVAQRAGLSAKTISRLCDGTADPALSTLEQVAKCFNVSVTALIDASGTSPHRSTPDEMTPMQAAVVDALQTLIAHNALSNRECIDLLAGWADKL